MKKPASLFLFILLSCTVLAPAAGVDELRGERVGWARLKTASLHWMRHARGDPELMQFLRENSSLNIDPTWYAADCEKLSEMCAYPMLFSQSVSVIHDAAGRNNVAEYMRRGGFLLVDACINAFINPDPDLFLVQQKLFFAEALPEAHIVALPENHEIYRCFFKIPDGKPPHTFSDNEYDEAWAKHGLYGVYIGSRMVGIISLSGLQCGWDRMIAPPGHNIACMRMMVNIYLYAMLRH